MIINPYIFGGFDPDAQAFITAASITNTTQQNAINTLVVDLKGYGVWSKMKAIYPFVGGTASTHKWNLKDPRDLDAAFRLVFNGGWTHSSTGATPNGTNGYANSYFNPFVNLGTNSNSLGYYTGSNLAETFADPINIGSLDLGTSTFYFLRKTNTTLDTRLNTNLLSVSNSSMRGFFNSSKQSSTVTKVYLNGTSLNSNIGGGTLPPYNVYIGATSTTGIPYGYVRNDFRLAYMSDGLTDTEASNLAITVESFQTTLGRSVNPWYNNGNLLLDDYPNAATAYSVRKLRNYYIGPCLRVRRSSDNAEQNIYFNPSGELDTTSLLSFVGAGNGFITTWYDQSTNGRNQTQTTAINQPRIVNNGILDIKGSKPCLNFDGINDFLFNMTGILNNVGISAFTVLSLNSLTQRCGAWDLGFPSSNNYFVLEANTNNTIGQRFGFYASGNSFDSNFSTNLNQNLISIFANTSIGSNIINNMNYYTNSNLRTLTLKGGSGSFGNFASANSITIGSFYLGAGNLFSGQIQEVIFYSSNIISNRVGMETNINSYFNIYP